MQNQDKLRFAMKYLIAGVVVGQRRNGSSPLTPYAMGGVIAEEISAVMKDLTDNETNGDAAKK